MSFNFNSANCFKSREKHPLRQRYRLRCVIWKIVCILISTFSISIKLIWLPFKSNGEWNEKFEWNVINFYIELNEHIRCESNWACSIKFTVVIFEENHVRLHRAPDWIYVRCSWEISIFPRHASHAAVPQDTSFMFIDAVVLCYWLSAHRLINLIICRQ